jgi:uncharacterized protein (TIGR02246 family)
VSRAASNHRPRIVVRTLACLACLATLSGCADGQPRHDLAARDLPPAQPELLPVTTSADPTAPDPRHLAIRPIPQVISRPQPFRLPPRLPLRSDASLAGGTLGSTAAALDPAVAATIPPREVARAGGPQAGEIRSMLRSYLRAFNRHDPAALAAHWTDAGESVDLVSGEVTAGRDAVRDVFAALFAEDTAATIDIDVQAIRPVRDDVAVVDGVTLITFADGQPAGSRFSAVVVREDGRWMLESVRETAHQVASQRPLDALAWLVGSWEDEGDGVTASTQCFWSVGRGFLVRTHSVSTTEPPRPLPAAGDDRIPGLLPPGTSSPRELTEIIGWDPERRSIRSWLFTSAGRFAEGTWTRAGDSWTVHVEGRGADEGSAVLCTLESTGPDGLTLRCDSGSLADLLPPACGFVRTARLGGPPAR